MAMEKIWIGSRPVEQQEEEDAIVLTKCSEGSKGEAILGLCDENYVLLTDENDEILE